MITVCSVLVVAGIAVCTVWPVLRCNKERSATMWSLTAAGAVRQVIVQEQEWSHNLGLIIGHYLLIMRKDVWSISNSIISAKASDHVTIMMHGGALFHNLTDEQYNNCRLCRWSTSSSCPSYAASPLLIKVYTAVLVRYKSKRFVRTYNTLDVYPLKKRSHKSQMPE